MWKNDGIYFEKIQLNDKKVSHDLTHKNVALFSVRPPDMGDAALLQRLQIPRVVPATQQQMRHKFGRAAYHYLPMVEIGLCGT